MPYPPSNRRAGNLDTLAFEADFAAVRHDRAGEDFHQRRLAGPVLSEDRVHLAAPQVEVNVLQRCDAAIVLSNASHLQERKLCLRRDSHGIVSSKAHEATMPSPLAVK